jgi:hypothetical protein
MKEEKKVNKTKLGNNKGIGERRKSREEKEGRRKRRNKKEGSEKLGDRKRENLKGGRNGKGAAEIEGIRKRF